MRRLRLLLAEDHATIRDALRLLLETKGNFQVVADVPDGEAALDAARAFEPDVALLEVAIPRLNGLAATRAIKQQAPKVAVVALTRHSEPVYLQELLAAGASGYVLKQSSFDVLLTAIIAAAAGNRFVDPAIGSYNATSGSVASPAAPAVSDREMSVMRLAATGKSNKDIATTLNIAVKTVEVHKANAMRKLELHDREDLVRFAVMHGWLLHSLPTRS
ncbi:MAG TPA: response regulator transcription factor [Vicinamibacterales bacterium]|nr:response regulator transcription factor [Vicinamibacterales bacterium]